MPVFLPDADPDPAAREAERAEARATYRYTWHRPEGVATAAEVPKSDGFSAGYLAKFGAASVKLKAHRVAVSTQNRVANAEADAAGKGLFARVAGAVEGVIGSEGSERRATPEVAIRWYGDDVPAYVQQRADHPEQSDLLFAWERLGGCNPMALRAIAALPDGLALPGARFAEALAVGGATDALDAALADGRVFLADWSSLAGSPTGTTAKGLAKHLFGARALFVQVKGGPFLPVAIQCEPDGPALTPADGDAWTIAKLVAQCADAHEQALTWHLAHCHFLMEAFTLATMRELAKAHPLRRLLAAHMEFTLSINAQVRDTLMKPEGDLEKLLSMTRGQSLVMVSEAMSAFDYAAVVPPANVAARGLGDAATLPQCPLREDGLDFWGAIHGFVSEYVGLYYATDAAVAEDAELRAWADDLRSHWGGRLETIPTPTDRATLAELVSFVLWTAGPFHTICNYSQDEYMGDSSSMPTALYAGAPGPAATAADLYAQYTPEDLSLDQYAFFWEQTQLRESEFGKYPPGTFDDPRVAPLTAAFAAALEAVDARIVERNAARPAAYEWLRPSQTRGSIHS